MKRILLVLIASFSMQILNGQTQFENSSFDTWENTGTPQQEPVQYSSLKTADATWLVLLGAPQVLWRETTIVHSGAASAKMQVQAYNSLAGLCPNGLITNGRVYAETVAANGYVFTDVANSQWNTPCPSRPDSLVGWYYHIPQGSDKGKVEVILHDDSQLGKLPATSYPMPHWVARARFDMVGGTGGAWMRFSVPFVYYNNTTPDYMLMVATPGDSTIAVDGSILYIDDFSLIYNPNLVSVTPPASQNINVGVNGALLTVNTTANAAVVSPITREWKYTTTSGSGYTAFGTPQTGTTYTPNFASTGIYYVVCEVNFGTETILSNEVEIVVVDPLVNTVSISPASTQTILLNDDGTLMTATETPTTATSREWKYSTVSGSGYGSFTTPITGLTYTPNFDVLDTYYVICESDFSGDIQLSNEVTIIVPSAAGINEEDLKFKIYNSENGLVLNMSDVQDNTFISVYSLDGKQIYTSQINSENSMHQVDAKGIYVYRVVSGNRIITGKINL